MLLLLSNLLSSLPLQRGGLSVMRSHGECDIKYVGAAPAPGADDGLKMKTRYLLLTVMWSVAAFAQEPESEPASLPAPPLSAPAERSAEDLEELVAPMALYPDPLIAVMLPAAVYPVEVVNAARFVADTNNLATLDDQPWDDNVKAVARFPEVIQYMSDRLDWTAELGEAFTEQPLELMDAIQDLRAKAQSAGTLQTTPEQVVIVTNAVVERTYETQIVYVTNTVVQIVPSDPQVIYVPVYNPAVVFAPPPTYVFNRRAPLITFRPGIRMGPRFANRYVNWYYGGVYYGPGGFPFWGFGRYQYFPPPPSFRPPPFRPRPGWGPPRPGFRPPGFPPPGVLPPGRPTPLPVRWRPSPSRRRGPPLRATAWDNRGWGTRPGPSPGRMGTRPGPPSPGNIRPDPGGSRPGPGGRGRPTPGRLASGSGLSDVSSGRDSRGFSRRGAASRRNSRGPRGNRGGSQE
jgi:hypothetical protein